jgi:hypothetical protein
VHPQARLWKHIGLPRSREGESARPIPQDPVLAAAGICATGYQPGRPPRLAVRPDQGITMLVRHHRRDHGHADHGRGRRPLDGPVRPGHHAPPTASSANSLVRSGAACWFFGAVPPRTHIHVCGLRLFFPRCGQLSKTAGHGRGGSSPSRTRAYVHALGNCVRLIAISPCLNARYARSPPRGPTG